jgi:methyltransferase (TIGR00027 family)
MKQDRSSETAQQMALTRAIESTKPAHRRICNDYYARYFLSFKYAMLVSNPLLSRFTEGMIERRFLGHHYYVVARTRYIDECLLKCAGKAMKQLVILGAGFDSRAYRFAKPLRETKIFEADHPATQARKKQKVKKLLGALPENVTYVPLDFCEEKIYEKLISSGYDEKNKTFFIWEGTTPYITAKAVDETLTFVSLRSGIGSSIVFDYILKSVVQGSCQLEGATSEFTYMAKTSEPFILGIQQSDIKSFLYERGFGSVKDVGADDLKKAYFKGRDENLRIKPWWRIVHAIVGH